MKIKVLGTAAATSMPLAFCNCRVCKEARLLGGKNHRKRSSILINDELLIDLGPDVISSCFQYNIDLTKVKYLCQTHSHSDHFDGGHFVTRWSGYKSEELNHLSIVCTLGTAKNMAHQIRENEPSLDLFNEEISKDLNYKLNIIVPLEKIRFDNYSIIALDSKHDERIEAIIYLIENKGKTILYGTDLLEITNATWNELKKHKIDVMFLDQTYGENSNSGGHLDAGMIKDIILHMKEEKIIDDKTIIYGTHFSHEGNDIHSVMEEKANANGYHIAYDGLEIVL